MKFKTGDKVKVRKWEDMYAEYGPCDMCEKLGDPDFGIEVPGGAFTKHMRALCDRPAVIKAIEGDCYLLRPLNFSDEVLNWDWHFNDNSLEPYQE